MHYGLLTSYGALRLLGAEAVREWPPDRVWVVTYQPGHAGEARANSYQGQQIAEMVPFGLEGIIPFTQRMRHQVTRVGAGYHLQLWLNAEQRVSGSLTQAEYQRFLDALTARR